MFPAPQEQPIFELARSSRIVYRIEGRPIEGKFAYPGLQQEISPRSWTA